MSRAVFTPTRGDPFLIEYWLRHFSSWRHMIDARLYLCVTSPQSSRVRESIRSSKYLRDGDVVFFSTVPLDHGDALQSLAFVTEDVVLLQEDDLFVRNGVAVRDLFDNVERGHCDVIAAPCHNCCQELTDAATARGYQPGLNPRILVARTNTLREVRETFSPRLWSAGETVEHLDHVCRDDCSGDIFVAASLELRRRARVAEFSADLPDWFHVGSLSTPGPLTDGADAALRGARAEGAAWAARVSWWERFIETWSGGLEGEYAEYRAVVVELASIVGHDHVDIAHAEYDALVNWSEA